MKSTIIEYSCYVELKEENIKNVEEFKRNFNKKFIVLNETNKDELYKSDIKECIYTSTTIDMFCAYAIISRNKIINSRHMYFN